MDQKMLAAGDRETSQAQQDYLEDYVSGALLHLLTFTRTEMSEDEQELWKKRLSTVPLWKLKRLFEEFTSPYINKVWEFFDGLRQSMPTYEPLALPEAKDNAGKDALQYIHSILFEKTDFKPTVWFKHHPEKYMQERAQWIKTQRKKEKDGLRELHRKYPTLGFDRWFGEKRFQGI